MEKPILNFEIFELPFFNEVKDKLNHNISKEDIEEEEENDIFKENMESRVPKSAIYLGAVETEVEHMTTIDYINECGFNYNKVNEKTWNLENKSIENTNDTGYYYIILKGEKIAFELEYTEGYFDKIIGTPYDTDEFGNDHGIFYY
jgi:hypothetical protein